METIKIGIFFLLVITVTTVSAQSWGTDGAEWYYSIPDPALNSPWYDYENFWIEKDTIIKNESCKLIQSNKDSSLIFLYKYDRVYLYFLDTFNLIYDYNVKIGDTVVFNIPAVTRQSFNLDTIINIECTLEYLDSFLIDNLFIKEFQFPLDTHNEDLDYLVWPSSYNYNSFVGFYTEFIFNLNHPSIDPITDIRCYSDQNINYQADWWTESGEPCDYEYKTQVAVKSYYIESDVNVFPTVSHNYFTIELPKGSTTVSMVIADLMGKIVVQEDLSNHIHFGESLSPGVYLINFFDSEADRIISSKKIIKLD